MKRRSIAPRLKARVLLAGDHKCFYCGTVAKVVDHIVPVALGGSDDAENLIAACRLCNHRKAADALGVEVLAGALTCASERAAKVREPAKVREIALAVRRGSPMTSAEFRVRLSEIGLSQPGFARFVSAAGGEELSPRTVQNWAQGHRPIPPTVPALLTMLLLALLTARDERWTSHKPRSALSTRRSTIRPTRMRCVCW